MRREIREEVLMKLDYVNILLESEMATPAYSFVYKQLLLQNSGEVTKEIFDKKIKSIVVTEHLIDKSISYIKAYEKNKKSKVILNNELETKIVQYIGLIYFTIYGDDNKKIETCISKEDIKIVLNKELNEKLLIFFMLAIKNSNLFNICSMIENETYKGYFSYKMSLKKYLDKGSK